MMDSNFTRKIAIETAIPKEVVDKVVKHSLSLLIRNMENCKSAEITGFGTFYLKEKRIPFYAKRYEEGIQNKREMLKLNTLTERVRKNMESSIGRMEKQLIEFKEKYGLE